MNKPKATVPTVIGDPTTVLVAVSITETVLEGDANGTTLPKNSGLNLQVFLGRAQIRHISNGSLP